jgi:diguanylate cyclase (GGDEF)-like protein
VIDSQPQRTLRQAVRLVGFILVPTGIVWGVIGALIASPSTLGVSLAAVVLAAWLIQEFRTSRGRSAATLAIRTAIAIDITLVVVATAEPSIGVAMAIGALIAPVLALPYVGRSAVAKLMAVGALSGTYAGLAPLLLPRSSSLPPPLDLLLPVSTLIVAYTVFHVFLWNASGRLTDTATELSKAMELSREVALTLDPLRVGEIIARHIALAVGASDCALSTWDRPNDRLLTFAYYPPERRSALDETYDLAAFPATRAVLMGAPPCRVGADDPAADPSERAYLASIGHRSMIVLPLVARGEAIGTLELTSIKTGAFGDQAVHLAQLLAREAAVALENARLYDEIHHQAFRDALTGLANRSLFHDRVTHALDRLRGRSPRRAAVLFLDLDHFKLLNDRVGHTRGDEVLRALAGRVRASIRPGDTAARLGGDEFAVLLEDVDGPDEARQVAERLLRDIERPIDGLDGAPVVAASLGVALSGSAGETADDLLRNADIAMYAAKEAGRGRIELFRPELLERAAARSELGARLRGAADRGELRIAYQPIVELDSGRRSIVGLEALVRWQPPGEALRQPAEFIELAEETGEIVPIGRWVVNEACRQAREWQEEFRRPDLRINVNLSARQFTDPGLVDVVAAALHRSGLAPACLTLEITESTLMQRTAETLGRVEGLRGLGVRLSIDDFGTGYSSLGYLQAFEVDELKIDRSFVSDASSIGDPKILSRAIVELGRALELDLVVEGVETAAQESWFASLGCQYAQGYLYARPLAAEMVGAHLATAKPATRSARARVRRPVPASRSA